MLLAFPCTSYSAPSSIEDCAVYGKSGSRYYKAPLKWESRTLQAGGKVLKSTIKLNENNGLASTKYAIDYGNGGAGEESEITPEAYNSKILLEYNTNLAVISLYYDKLIEESSKSDFLDYKWSGNLSVYDVLFCTLPRALTGSYDIDADRFEYLTSSYISKVSKISSNSSTEKLACLSSGIAEDDAKDALLKAISLVDKVSNVVSYSDGNMSDLDYVHKYDPDMSKDVFSEEHFKSVYLNSNGKDARRDAVVYLCHMLKDKGALNVSADQQQEAGAVVSTDGLTSTGLHADWYRAAYKIASGIKPGEEGWGLSEEYNTTAALYSEMSARIGEASQIDANAVYKQVYDIMCLAYSKGADNTADWDIPGEGYDSLLKYIHGLAKSKSLGSGAYPQGVTSYSAWSQELQSLDASTTDDAVKRMQSFRTRISALYHISTLTNGDITDDQYSWINQYYEQNQDNVYIPSDLFKDDEDLCSMSFISFNGDIVKDAPKCNFNEMIMPYLLNTVWEMPYLTKYMAVDLNDAITNSTILQHGALYEGLKSIHQAVEEFGMPLMKKLWEYECVEEDVPYKSLKAMWEACEKNPEIADQLNQEKVILSSGKPLQQFFTDYTSGVLSDYYLQGIAYTATLVPMRSNVYSQEWLNYMNSDFRNNFYEQWGFNRKALYMDNSAGAGEEYYVSGKPARGDLKVCTLRDLLDCNGEIVLYLDDNFYNAKSLKENTYINPSYAGETKEGETEQQSTWYMNMAMSLEEAFNASFENIVKTGPNTNYSKTFYDMMSTVQGSHTYYAEATVDNPGNTDNIVLNSGKINYYLKPENTGSEIYTPLQSYAVVSSVYRDGTLFTMANSESKQRPVFISSKTAPYAKGATAEQKMVIYNYALLKNLKAAMPVGYTGSLDMDCPLYMDILGNIITESGTVVVPAVSNATIMNHGTYYQSCWGAGLFSIYGIDYQIPVKANDANTIGPVIDGIFEVDESGKHYVTSPRTLGDDYSIDMSRLSAMSKDTMSLLYERAYSDLANTAMTTEPMYDFNSYFQICMEVLRGAPIENIDKELEGIDTSGRTDRAGIVAAAKLEELNKALDTNGENSTIALPSMAFMPGFNYIALIAFKLLLLVVIVVAMITVYYDTVSDSLNVGTLVKCIWVMVLTMIVVVTVPTVFDVTYYQSNRALLQNETAYISMLNLEKEESGVEIGVTEVRDPDIKTVLYLKLEDIKVPWYELFYNSVHTDTYKTLNQMYDNYAQEHSAIAYRDDVEVKNDGVYMNVTDIYKTSSIDVNMSSSDANKVTLVQTAEKSTSTFSFYSPYYAILDALIQNVNYFNANPTDDESSQGWYSYTTTTQKGGKLKTMGLIEPYLTSSNFMDNHMKDPLGLKAIYADKVQYGYNPDPATYGYYSASNLNYMTQTYWYPSDISTSELEKRIDYLTKEARTFVANNKDLLGKISDETFLKVMAMDIALKHNRILGCEYASAYEISNLSGDDLIRLSVADRGEVMLNSSLSYPRFIYSVGGTPAVFAAAMLSMVMWISGIVKPILVIVAFLTIFVSVFVFKICARKESVSLYGYFITTLLLCGTNILYSVILKLSMYLPVLGLTPFMCILLQIVIQIAYLVVLLNVVGTAFKDWRDLGFARYANKSHDIKVNLMGMFNKNKGASNPNFEGSSRQSDPEKNWKYYDDMLDEHKRRNQ